LVSKEKQQLSRAEISIHIVRCIVFNARASASAAYLSFERCRAFGEHLRRYSGGCATIIEGLAEPLAPSSGNDYVLLRIGEETPTREV